MASPAPVAFGVHSSALQKLIAAQQADDRQVRMHGTHECDLAGPDEPDAPMLDRLADPRQAEPSEILEAIEVAELTINEGIRRRAGSGLGLRLVGISEVWTVKQTRFDPKRGPCPTCAGELARGEQCLICSASHDEPTPHAMVGKLPIEAPSKPRPLAARVVAKRARGSTKGRPARRLLDAVGKP